MLGYVNEALRHLPLDTKALQPPTLIIFLLNYIFQNPRLSMTDLVTSSPPEHSVAVSESEAQLDRLDSLLEQYLNLLHEYQKTRSEVSEHFSKVRL